MLTAAGKKLVFIVWSKEMFLPYSLSVLSSPHNCYIWLLEWAQNAGAQLCKHIFNEI